MLGLSKCKPVLQLQDHLLSYYFWCGRMHCEDTYGINVRAGEAVVMQGEMCACNQMYLLLLSPESLSKCLP